MTVTLNRLMATRAVMVDALGLAWSGPRPFGRSDVGATVSSQEGVGTVVLQNFSAADIQQATTESVEHWGKKRP